MFVICLASYWSDHKRSLEEKIQRLTHEIHQLKTEKKTNVSVAGSLPLSLGSVRP